MRRTRIEHILSANIAHKMACKCCQDKYVLLDLGGKPGRPPKPWPPMRWPGRGLPQAGRWPEKRLGGLPSGALDGHGTDRFVALPSRPS